MVRVRVRVRVSRRLDHAIRKWNVNNCHLEAYLGNTRYYNKNDFIIALTIHGNYLYSASQRVNPRDGSCSDKEDTNIIRKWNLSRNRFVGELTGHQNGLEALISEQHGLYSIGSMEIATWGYTNNFDGYNETDHDNSSYGSF